MKNLPCQPDRHDQEKELLLQKIDRIRALPIDMADIPVHTGSVLAEQTLLQVWTKTDLSLLPVAISRNNRFLFVSISRERLHPGDTLIVIGQPASIQELKSLALP